MRKLNSLIISVLLSISFSFAQKAINNLPIRLHPYNPHYFEYKGETMALITSAEHYGSVLNLDFDYNTYLKTLASQGMNYTRIFTGSYFENPGDFGIEHNVLAPANGRAITPWKRLSSGKWDLSTFNEAYFNRLKDFISKAQENDIIVEVTLFSSIYQDKNWDLIPQNPANNINLTDSISRFDAQTINNKGLMKFQKAMVSKIVNELNDFNNLFYEIQNEPWSDHNVPVYNIMNKEELKEGDWQMKADFASKESLDWQKEIAKTIRSNEAKLPKKHLIAQNYVNYKAAIPEVESNIDIINFHYAWPEAVTWNYHYNKVIGFDESGFAGSGDQVYRRQAWKFMLSGGGLFNNLDYSFYVGKESGKGTNKAPGGGSTELRSQLKVLSDFLHSLSLEKYKPNYSCVASSKGLIPHVISNGNKEFGIFLISNGTKASTISISCDQGTYDVFTLNTSTGEEKNQVIRSNEGQLLIPILIPDGELALKIIKR